VLEEFRKLVLTEMEMFAAAEALRSRDATKMRDQIK
jgi:hypothetical protein